MSSMTLDATTQHYNVRECNNTVRVTVTKTQHNTYVSYDRLVQGKWQHVPNSTVGLGSRDPRTYAEQMYNSAFEKFGRGE